MPRRLAATSAFRDVRREPVAILDCPPVSEVAARDFSKRARRARALTVSLLHVRGDAQRESIGCRSVPVRQLEPSSRRGRMDGIAGGAVVARHTMRIFLLTSWRRLTFVVVFRIPNGSGTHRPRGASALCRRPQREQRRLQNRAGAGRLAFARCDSGKRGVNISTAKVDDWFRSCERALEPRKFKSRS